MDELLLLLFCCFVVVVLLLCCCCVFVVGGCGCCVVVVVVVVVVVLTVCNTRESVLPRALLHIIQVAERLGASSRRPRHPKPSTTKNSSSSRAEKWALTSMRTE